MRCRSLIGFMLVLALMPAYAGVTVTYGDPDRFSDAGDRWNDPVKVAQTLADHLRKLGDQVLPPGTDVRIEILDLDRAGRTAMNLPTEIRIINGKTDMPCIDLRYEVTSGGATTSPKRERVCDPQFLRSLEPRYSEHDPLVYEKRMLDEWFRARFTATPRR